MWHRLLIGILAMATVSCKFDYRGDGDFIDRGSSAAVDRYVLDLGKVQPGASKALLGALPSTEFVIGLQVAGLSPDQAERISAAVVESVEVSLVRASGTTDFRESVPLRDWVWTCGAGGCSNAFAYLRDLREEGGAPGTCFLPRGHETYNLRIKIPPAGFFGAHEVHLVARGGGWK